MNYPELLPGMRYVYLTSEFSKVHISRVTIPELTLCSRSRSWEAVGVGFKPEDICGQCIARLPRKVKEKMKT